MFKPVTMATAVAMTMVSVSPALAFDNTFSSPLGDRFGNRLGVGAGVYLKIPFTGGLKRKDQAVPRFGFAMTATREFQTGLLLTDPQQRMQANLLDLKFSPQGFRSFAIGGQDVIDYRTMRLGADGEKGGNKLRSLAIGAGLVVLVIGGAVGAQAIFENG